MLISTANTSRDEDTALCGKRCLICHDSIAADAEPYCSTRKKDGGLVCPRCTALVHKGNTDALRKLAESSAVWIKVPTVSRKCGHLYTGGANGIDLGKA